MENFSSFLSLKMSYVQLSFHIQVVSSLLTRNFQKEQYDTFLLDEFAFKISFISPQVA